MSFLSSLLGGVGKVASVAAPFLGKFSPLAGLLGGVLAGGSDSKKANNYAGQIGGIGDQQAQLAKFQGPLLQALMGKAGFDSSGGYDPNYNPNAASANALFGPNTLNGQMVAGQEQTAPVYDNAVNSIRADFLRRGFGGGANTGFNSAVGNVRTQQATDNAGARRGLLYNLENQKRSFLEQGLQDKNNALTGSLGFANNSAQGALGTLGGLQGFYQNRADQTNQGIGQAINKGAESGIFNPAVDNISSWIKDRFGLKNRIKVNTPTTMPTTGGYVPQRTTGGAAGTVGWGI